MSVTGKTSVPVVDLDLSDEDLAPFLRAACTDVGFFYIRNHGVSQKLMDKVLSQSALLFALSPESKGRLVDSRMSRGYTGMGEETLDPAKQTRGDTKEGFYIGINISEDSPLYDPSKFSGPNQWPTPVSCPEMAEPEIFRQVMEEYHESMCNLGLRLVRLLALSVGIEKHYWDDSFRHPLALLRLLHYNNEASKPEDGVFACGAHSDYGMLTLLLTDKTTPGLQVLQNDTWIDVPPLDGTLVVNLGDMLERWTNHLFRSTKHRVLTSGESHRFSVPFFFEPNFDTVVECLDTCCSPENPPSYSPTTSGKHLLEKYATTHADFEPENII